MKYPKYDKLEWFIIALTVTILIAVALLLSGCASSQKAQKLDILCVGSGQVFHATGISAHQAGTITNDWDFGACDVTIQGKESSGIK